MKTSDIITHVASIVQDSSFDSAAILVLINEARQFIAANVDLPALRTSYDLTTTSTASSVSLPANYLRDIFWVGSVSQGRRIGERQGDYYNLLTFNEVYPVTEGNIEAVCVDGSLLRYRGMADDTLTIKYYSAPVDIVTTTDVPSELPDHLQRPVLAAYCCKEFFARIEDGIEGAKANTTYWETQFAKSIAALELFIARNKPREPKRIREVE